ncbi:hypothetical protein G5B46_21920 [Caulobacter sp. 602-2]|uniref:Lipoprotein n=1 Tax=Caulobacter sp. 602-2 TaxID=2710887 RepID=A0A6G4R2X4_9CAUL|nr:hypothetical protein [Caulobacter sp. 602-2]NGM52276.1 hypothetical protein [Caulobacter sp. 602-2]
MTVAMKRGLYRICAVLIGAGLALSACASVPSSPPGIESITYRPSPPPFCGGRCETTTFTVGIDGVVRGETVYQPGRFGDWRRRRILRQVTPERVAAFRRALEPYRPAADRSVQQDSCQAYWTDQDAVSIEWSKGDERVTLFVDLGCQDDLAMNDVLRQAPGALGL